MKAYINLIFGTKTGRTSLGSIVALWIGYANAAVNLNEAIIGTVAAVQAVNIRHGIAKSTPPEAPK